MKTATVTRTTSGPKATNGTILLKDGPLVLFSGFTVELPWMNNAPRKSCIPKGSYTCEMRTSPKFGLVPHVLNVPGRTAILIHPANYARQLLGCIALGLSSADIDGDGTLDVASSKEAVRRFIEALGGDKSFALVVR